jgi:hypothetical protein
MKVRENMESDSFFDLLNENPPVTSPDSKGEAESPAFKEDIIPNERIAFLLFPFFIELIDQFKDTLKKLRNQTRNFQEKLSNKELGGYFSQLIAEDIKKIELLQNSLFSYIRINNPIIKTNTVNTLIEEELIKYQVELEEKRIKLLKTLESDLPEIPVPDDQLRYVLTFLLQYMIALMPPNGYLRLYTRSGILQKETNEDRTLDKKEEKYVELLMMHTGYKKPVTQFGSGLGNPAKRSEGVLDLMLRLVDEIVKRNHGLMKFEVDEKLGRNTISLRFPKERRKIAYYHPSNEATSTRQISKTTFEKLTSLEEKKKKD